MSQKPPFSIRMNGVPIPAAPPDPEAEKKARYEAMREDARVRIRAVINRCRDYILGHEDMPEAIEFYDWRFVPHTDDYIVVVEVEDAAPGQVSVRVGESLAPAEPPARRRVAVNRKMIGEITVPSPIGEVTLPWWCGWDEEERVAVIACGP